MRAFCACVLFVGLGCGPASAPRPPLRSPPPQPIEVVLPVVETGTLSPSDLVVPPAAIVFVSDTGALTIGRIAKDWDGTLPRDRKPVGNPLALKREILTAVVEAGGARADDARILLAPGDSSLDDPPPPEEEVKPEDGEDESGGSGTAMALEEGKMGKKESDRAEGQYKMEKNRDDPQLARQQAIEQARAAGILEASGSRGRATLFEASDVSALPPYTPLIAPTPNAPASAIVRVIEAAGSGSLAVERGDVMRLLPVGFRMRRDESGYSGYGVVGGGRWMEIHLQADGIHVLEAGRQAITVAWKDRAGFAAALEKTRASERFTGMAPAADILVASDGGTAQQLVDVIVAVTGSGSGVSIGPLPEPSADRVAKLIKARRDATPTVSIGQPNAQGDLDKAIIRRYIKRNIQKIQYCYEKELVAKPTLAGTVLASFYIEPSGKVGRATGSGVDPEVANCIANVIKGIEFPKPKGGGGVQVNYPFSFRPAD